MKLPFERSVAQTSNGDLYTFTCRMPPTTDPEVFNRPVAWIASSWPSGCSASTRLRHIVDYSMSGEDGPEPSDTYWEFEAATLDEQEAVQFSLAWEVPV